MTPERAKLFAELLEEVATVEGGFIPEVAWMQLHRIVPMPAVELIIHQNERKEFLLTMRRDKFWNGWHIPGGFILQRETIPDATKRIVQRELKIQGVTNIKPIAIKKWDKHPYGSPISLVLVCSAVGKIEETEEMRFFDHIPTPIIPNHEEFLGEFLRCVNFQENQAVLL